MLPRDCKRSAAGERGWLAGFRAALAMAVLLGCGASLTHAQSKQEERLQDSARVLKEVMDNCIDEHMMGYGKQIDLEVAPVIANYQEGVTAESALLQVKEYFYRKKYLDRMLRQLEELGFSSSR